jgi:hypothetical protein
MPQDAGQVFDAPTAERHLAAGMAVAMLARIIHGSFVHNAG